MMVPAVGPRHSLARVVPSVTAVRSTDGMFDIASIDQNEALNAQIGVEARRITAVLDATPNSEHAQAPHQSRHLQSQHLLL